MSTFWLFVKLSCLMGGLAVLSLWDRPRALAIFERMMQA